MKNPIKLDESERESVRRIVSAVWLVVVSGGQTIKHNSHREQLNTWAREVGKDVVEILTEPLNPKA